MGILLSKFWAVGRTLGRFLGLLGAAVLLSISAAATPPQAERAALIVLLDAESRGAPPAEEVVREVNGGRPAPGDLPVGKPRHADFGLTHRAQGSVKAWLHNNPDETLARLHRYVVLEYPENANIDALAEALRHHPHVLHVERDIEGHFSSVSNPNDPFLVFDPNPINYQWGHYLLNVPAAWELTGGHGYVGLADSGVQVEHPDLRAFHKVTSNGSTFWTYEGGNVRTHLAWDFGDNDGNVDELGPSINGAIPPAAGHGTHIAGLIAATADNGLGVGGVCQHCSVVPSKITTVQGVGFESNTAEALQAGASSGLQVMSLSLGFAPRDCASTSGSLALICSAIDFTAERQLLVTAASGNDRLAIEFPANEPRVLAIGGLGVSGDFWDEFPNCPIQGEETECGSNFSGTPIEHQSLVAPAKSVLSSIYEGQLWNAIAQCGDAYHPAPGYGPCTGTSMAAPYVAGIAGMVRSINPLLPQDEIRTALETTASLGDLPTPDPKFGYGIPDAYAAVRRVLGTVGGRPLDNRLTPLFSLFSGAASTHLYTSVPQMAAAAVFDCQAPFVSEGLQVIGYPMFPGVFEEPCPVSPCVSVAPRAAVYLFTTPNAPYFGAPPLKPLFRMSYDPDFATRCRDGQKPPQVRRGFFYTTSEVLLPAFKDAGYELDGREGYIYARCTPEPDCIPEGAVRLYRLYSPSRDDWAIFPEPELASWQAIGYATVAGLDAWIGYAYPNLDSDNDGLIDAFENLIGTDPARSDSDCDSVADGAELMGGALVGQYADPADGPCLGVPELIFSDDFEQGNLVKWLVFAE